MSSTPTKLKGKDLFSSLVWKDSLSTSTFYTFIAALRRKIWVDVQQPSRAHSFIRVLRDSNRLVRCYTQNIDGLECREGLCTDLDRGKGCRTRFSKKSMQLPRTAARQLAGGVLDGGCEVVQLHGDLEVLKCSFCPATCGWDEQGREARFLMGEAPTCPSCEVLAEERRDRGKRGTRIGLLRPNIVLYGEEHPLADRIGKLSVHDLSLAPDLLLILGTSLQVHGLKLLVKEFAKSVHARGRGKGKVIFVNLSRPSESMWKNVIDYWVNMDCDEWVDSVRVHRPDLWKMQTELDVQIRKPKSSPAKKRRDRKEVTADRGKRKDSRASGQNILCEPPRIPSMGPPEREPGKTESKKEGREVTSCVLLATKVAKPKDFEDISGGTDGMKSKKRAKPNVHSNSGLDSTLPLLHSTPRPPLQSIPNESFTPSLKTPLPAHLVSVTSSPEEIEKVSSFFVGELSLEALKHKECQQQRSHVTSESDERCTEPGINQQLLTPPPSGHRPRFQDRPRKRGLDIDVDIRGTRIKRFRADLQIWQDEDIGPDVVDST